MSLCHERIAVKIDKEGRTAVSLPCQAWTCDHCRDKRQARLIAEACGGQPNTFLTLTLRRSQAPSPEAAAKTLSRCWRILRLRILRKYRWRRLPFFAVFERHKSGWPHLHILLRSGWIDHAWLSATMAAIANSPIVGIERIKHQGRVVAYVAKYVSKEPFKFGTAKRYWQSPDYDLRDDPPPKPEYPPGFGWEIQPTDLKTYADAFQKHGYIVTWTGSHKVRIKSPHPS